MAKTTYKKGQNKKRYRIVTSTLIGIALFVGFSLGILYKTIYPTQYSSLYKQVRTGGYEYINPLVDFEEIESAKAEDIVKLEKDLQEYIKGKTAHTSQSGVTHISVYYKDLNSGAWIGVNENEDFSPASLLKLPMMIVAYKVAESDSNFLQQKIVFHKTTDSEITQNFVPEQSMEEGKEYTLDEIINRLIKYSDNDAIQYILDSLTYEQITGIYKELGMENPYIDSDDKIMSVKEYSGFFRILYNASYLNKEMSIKALKLLSETEYDEGLESGIPNDIKIADKFGERVDKDDQSERKQLHDCGIVYHPVKPYLLCVMTQGYDFASLETVLKEVSKTVFDQVNTK
jgi:beta-lactamase class A